MITVTHEKGFRIVADVRGHRVIADLKQPNGGTDTAPQASEYIEAALALCVSTYFNMYCAKRDLDPHGHTVTLESKVAEAPKRYSAFAVTLQFPPGFPEDAKEGAKGFVKACMVANTLKSTPDVSYFFA
ncbi:MAG: OsmC family protein [Candidatus Brocadiia bacterium]